MFLVSGAPSMGRDSLSTLAPVDRSAPNTLTASADEPTRTTKASAAMTATEREGRPGTTADRIRRYGHRSVAPVSCGAVVEAGEEIARAPKPHWALVGLLWVLAGALCVLGPNGRVLASLAKPALTAAEEASAPLPPAFSVSPANGATNVMPATVVTVASHDQ